MASSTLSAPGPEARLPAVFPKLPPRIADPNTTVLGRLLELGCSTFNRNVERNISHLQSLARSSSISEFLLHQEQFLRTFWRDQENALQAATKILRNAFEERKTSPGTARSNSRSLPVSAAQSSPRSEPVFEIYLDKAGEYRFRLKAADDGVLLKSEGYKSHRGALNGVASVRKNAPNPARYQQQATASGRHHVNLKAGNHQVIGSSGPFASPDETTDAIERIRKTAASSPIVDQTRAG